MEYPSRSNLNCLIVVLRGLGRKGDEHYEPYNYFVDFHCKSDHYQYLNFKELNCDV